MASLQPATTPAVQAIPAGTPGIAQPVITVSTTTTAACTPASPSTSEDGKKPRQQMSGVCGVGTSIPRVTSIFQSIFQGPNGAQDQQVVRAINAKLKEAKSGAAPLAPEQIQALTAKRDEITGQRIRVAGTAAPTMAALLDWIVQRLYDAAFTNMKAKNHHTIDIVNVFVPENRPETGVKPEECPMWPFIATIPVEYNFQEKAKQERKIFFTYARKICDNYVKDKDIVRHRVAARFHDYAALVMEEVTKKFATILKDQLAHNGPRTVNPQKICELARTLQIFFNRPAAEIKDLQERMMTTVALKTQHNKNEGAKRLQRQAAKVLEMTPEERLAYDLKQKQLKQEKLQRALATSQKRAQAAALKAQTTQTELQALVSA